MHLVIVYLPSLYPSLYVNVSLIVYVNLTLDVYANVSLGVYMHLLAVHLPNVHLITMH